jgi:SAM-dependent methyltransferase
MRPSDERRLIDEQIDYYRRRAPEYDRTSAPVEDFLAPQGEQLRDALHAFAPSGNVLELACGTGQWTRELLKFASHITALDSSPEMIAINRRKVDTPNVHYVVADLFDWQPDNPYDVVFFGFWISHVPAAMFEPFWQLVDRCLAPRGRVFFVDEMEAGDWRHEEFLEESGEVVRRRLSDGTEHRAVKHFWDPAQLQKRLTDLGWSITVRGTHDNGPLPSAFLWGHGTRARDA